jgi:trimeric autotransporter adhesin
MLRRNHVPKVAAVGRSADKSVGRSSRARLVRSARRLGAIEPLEDRRLLSVDLQLLKDINTLPVPLSSGASGLVDVGGVAYFAATTAAHGTELWKSDGTLAGTQLVKDLNVGSASSRPRKLTNVNNTLFFFADDGTTGFELWKSDGTTAGTVRVKDIHVGSGSSLDNNIDLLDPQLINLNGSLYFRANDGSGYGLWRSDGTEAGTVLVKNISPSNLTNVSGTLYLQGCDGISGCELWRSDGTEAGTTLVKDISASNLTNVSGTLYFRASATGDNFCCGTNRDMELWKSDGTEAGTVRVKDINPGLGGAYPGWLANVNGTLYFRATHPSTGSELWKSDGTAAGTVPIKDINPGMADGFWAYLTQVGETVYFTANDGTSVREVGCTGL